MHVEAPFFPVLWLELNPPLLGNLYFVLSPGSYIGVPNIASPSSSVNDAAVLRFKFDFLIPLLSRTPSTATNRSWYVSTVDVSVIFGWIETFAFGDGVVVSSVGVVSVYVVLVVVDAGIGDKTLLLLIFDVGAIASLSTTSSDTEDKDRVGGPSISIAYGDVTPSDYGIVYKLLLLF